MRVTTPTDEGMNEINESSETFEDLVADFRPQLVVYGRSIDPRGAEDAVQDAFEALRKREQRPPPIENRRGYLVRIVQRAQRRPTRLARFIPPPAEVLDHYRDPGVARALARLPERQRDCLALRYGQDQKLTDIAELLGITEGSVKQHIARGLATLRTRLETTNA